MPRFDVVSFVYRGLGGAFSDDTRSDDEHGCFRGKATRGGAEAVTPRNKKCGVIVSVSSISSILTCE